MWAEVKKSIEANVLCWLATADPSGMPNVSPKEVFTYTDHGEIIIANIASPQSAKNVRANDKVCVSFIDILVQKGFQIRGTCTLVTRGDRQFDLLEKPLLKITQGKYPFASVFLIKVDHIKPIIAPSYHLYPEISENERIEAAKTAYGLSE